MTSKFSVHPTLYTSHTTTASIEGNWTCQLKWKKTWKYLRFSPDSLIQYITETTQFKEDRKLVELREKIWRNIY